MESALPNFPDCEIYKGALAKAAVIGVEGNCSSKSRGGEDDSTGLRTQTATITPRTRCVPPEALISAATAKTKALKRGAARFPVLVFASPGTPISRLANCQDANREIGVPGKEMCARQAFDYVCRGDPSESFLPCFCVWFSFWTLKQPREPPPRTLSERRESQAGWRAKLWRTKARYGKVFSR